MDFDETRLYYSHQQLQSTTAEEENEQQQQQAAQTVSQEEEGINLEACRRHFREFLRKFQTRGHTMILQESPF